MKKQSQEFPTLHFSKALESANEKKDEYYRNTMIVIISE